MEYCVYILWSYSAKKSYVGFTSCVIERMKSHNELGRNWTASYRPWILVHIEFFETKQQAMQREKYFKSGRGLYKKMEIINEFLKI